MRKTSAPAWNSRAMTVRSPEAGPSVATTLVRRCRLIARSRHCHELALSWSFISARRRRHDARRGLRRRGRRGRGRPDRGSGRRGSAHGRRFLYGLLARFGQLHGPGALFAGIDLEKAGAVVTAGQAIADAADRKFLVAGAHIGFAHPFAAAIIIDGVDIIITGDKAAFEHRLATACRQVPPAFRGPALPVLVADGDTDPARRVVA